MASNEETNAAGTDTRPPMLVESDYDSWKIRIHSWKEENKLEMGVLKLKSFSVKVDPPHSTKEDMMISQLNIPTHQYGNTKFVNKLPLIGEFPPTNNQLWTSSNSKTHATVHDGQIVTEPIQRKGSGHVASSVRTEEKDGLSSTSKDKALLMEAKRTRRFDVLDA
ncbi:hypothetical protein Tco_0859419 [Tanacetum coccineum]|uniref:DUF4219 domain-containing protein n=1 Tax=Tanacetum coccineum TaxID=301880 RepID=A0ABQ5BE62_9ASTR